MGRRRAAPPRGRRSAPSRPLLVAVGVLLTVGFVVAGITLDSTWELPGQTSNGSARTSPAASRTPAPTASAGGLDLSKLPVERAPFCDLVDDGALETALGGGPTEAREAYTDGDEIRLASGLTEIGHEHGCVFTAGATEATAWVFVPPVSTPDARELLAEARSDDDCTFPRESPAFGTPGLTSVCERDDTTEVTHRGLFGDAWLTCRLTDAARSPVEVQTAADQWCVHLVTTLGARP